MLAPSTSKCRVKLTKANLGTGETTPSLLHHFSLRRKPRYGLPILCHGQFDHAFRARLYIANFDIAGQRGTFTLACSCRRGGRVVYRGGLENRWAARPRGFESLPLRQCFSSKEEEAATIEFIARSGLKKPAFPKSPLQEPAGRPEVLKPTHARNAADHRNPHP